MSNVFVKGMNFFPVPQYLMTSGLHKELAGGAIKLYMLILYTAQKLTRVELELSNEHIRGEADLCPNTIRRARTKLKESGLIDLKRISGGRYIYVLLDPLTRQPLPPRRFSSGGNSPGENNLAPNSLTPALKPTPCSASISPSWSDIGH